MAKVKDGIPYKIISSVNLLALDVYGGQAKDRIPIVPYGWNARPNQIWVPEQINGKENVFFLSSMAGRSFVMDNSEREQGRLLTFSKHGRENQQWTFEPMFPGGFDVFIQSVKDGKVLELTMDGRDVRLVPRNVSSRNQRWILSEA